MPALPSVPVMRRRQVGVVAAALVLAVVAAACDGDADAADRPTGTPVPSPSYQEGEREPGSTARLCAKVSQRTVRMVGMKAPFRDYDEDDHRCEWTEDESTEHVFVERELTVRIQAYEPPATRRDYSATDEAKHRFRRIDGWGLRETSRVRGLADEAKLARSLDPASRGGEVLLAARHRNVIVDVRVRVNPRSVRVSRRAVAYGALERAALSAMSEVLGGLTGRPVPKPTASAKPGAGEVSAVRDVCAAVRTAGRLAPGVPRLADSRRDSRRAGRCAWVGDEYRQPSLIVEVAAIAPSGVDGASGTQVARQLFDGIDGKETGHEGLGDEAKVDTVDYSSGGRGITLVVREGNLLVAVNHDREHDATKRQLERDAARVARDVLAGYR